MQNFSQNKPNIDSIPPGNHDGSDKNYGGYNKNGKPLTPPEERSNQGDTLKSDKDRLKPSANPASHNRMSGDGEI